MAYYTHQHSKAVRRRLAKAYANGQSLFSLCKQAGVYVSTGTQWLAEFKVAKRPWPLPGYAKKTCDESAFSRDLLEPVAYWAGFLMADGCVLTRRNLWYVAVDLAEADRGHLEKFAAFLKTDPAGIKSNRAGFVSLSVASAKLATSLIALGVTPRKTHTARPCLALANNRHFWRGYIDGDGHLSCRRRPDVEVVGSWHTLRLLRSFSGLPAKITERTDKHIWRVAFHGYSAVQLITRLYGSCHTVLDRKAKTATECVAKWMQPQGVRSSGLRQFPVEGYSPATEGE